MFLSPFLDGVTHSVFFSETKQIKELALDLHSQMKLMLFCCYN